MKRSIIHILAACAACLEAGSATVFADNIDDRIVDLNATVSGTVPHITLTWTHRLPSSTTGYTVFRRFKGERYWIKLADLVKTGTTYADSAVSPGINYEYKVERARSVTTPPVAYGYVCSGVDVPAVENRGKLVLLVDNTMTTPLATEIAQLEQDLVGDGWKVIRHDVPRMTTNPATTGTAVGPARLAELQAVKDLILADYGADPANVKAVYLLGRIPVPYSGNDAPGGHGDHYGAWPADVYYGNLADEWTDHTVDNSASTLLDPRNRNIPGDGKFDRNNQSGTVLQVGRVDLSNMTKFPDAGTSETELLRRYLNRAHAFRHRQGDFDTISRKAFIDYNFGYNYILTYTGFAWTGWMTGYSWFGRGNVFQGSWFVTGSTYNAVNQSYLYGYADGGGGFESIGDVGTSTDFGTTPSKVVFNALFGSYFGDWDRANCILRAPLAGTTSSHGLASFWPGPILVGSVYDDNAGTFRRAIPSWIMHPMAMGETIGYCARIAQAMDTELYGTWTPLYQVGKTQPALMGDPSLRAFVPTPVTSLTASDNSGDADLAWSPPAEPDLLGHHIYRAADPGGPYTRLNATLVTGTNYTDTTIPSSQTWHCMVRAVIKETTGSGSYENMAQGAFAPVAVAATSRMASGPIRADSRATIRSRPLTRPATGSPT